MGLTQVSTDGVKNDAITKTKIPANQIEASELADNAVDTNAIANNAVTAGKLASGVQTTINNNADNRVITGSGTANTLNGESNVIIDSSTGKVAIGTTTTDTGGLVIDKNITAESDASDTANYHLVIKSQSNSNTSKVGIAFKNTSSVTDVGAAILHHRTGGGSVGHLAFYTSPSSGTTSERMRIDSSGNVGINDTSPDAELAIAAVSGNAPHIDIGQAGGNRFKLGYEGNNCFFGASSSTGMFIFKSNVSSAGHPQADGTERMRIDSSGQLHIGNTGAPSTKGFSVLETSQSSTFLQIAHNVTGAEYSYFNFQHNGSTIGSIKQNNAGNAISFNTSSDYRLKENITAISDGITRLKTLKPSRFNFKVDASTTVDGFIAHEVTAVPEAISGTKDEVDSDNNPVYQGIDQSKLVPLLTAALQEAIAKIEVLETKVAALEAG